MCRCGLTPKATLLTRKGLKASEAEIGHNPRARSAILRAVEKLPLQDAASRRQEPN